MPRRKKELGEAPVAGGDEAAAETPHYHGHRDRLRQRFLEGGPDALPDYELLELLLYVIPRQDVKPLAKRLIDHFGSFANVLAASGEELAKNGIASPATLAQLKSVQAAALRMARQELADRPVIGSWKKLIDYCHSKMAREKVEQFRVLFLDSKNALIKDEELNRGTVNHTPVYPREVVKRALEHGAAAIIMVHNHPSGDPTPSQDDIAMTREIAAAVDKIGIALHDHVVIGRKGHASFRSLGLL